jgi:predicted RNA-binding protein
MRVTLIEDRSEEVQFEEVTSLEVKGDSVAINSFFEKPRTLQHTIIERIDCLAHTVLLRRLTKPQLAGDKS